VTYHLDKSDCCDPAKFCPSLLDFVILWRKNKNFAKGSYMKAKNEALSVETKLAYGAGDLGAAIVAAISGFFLNAFLLDVAQLRPGLVGIVFFIATFWDAVNDPIIGNLSDRTRTRWGRRRPWLLFGALPFGIAFWLHWVVPPLDETGLFFYYLIVAILLKTAFTAVNVPYTTLTAELTHDYNERTRLTAYRFSFSILGGVAAVGLQPVLVGLMPDERAGYLLAAAVWGVVIVISSWITFAFTREPDSSTLPPATETQYSFWGGLRAAFSNRPFLYVTGIYLCAWLTLQFIQSNLLLYVRYWIGAEDSFTLLVLILQVTAFSFLAVWSWFSGRYGKKRTYYVGATIWAVVLVAVFFVPAGDITPLYFVAFFAGVGLSVAYLIPWSMLPDVVEYDEWQNGQRREGLYYGFFVLLQQVGLSLGLALSNFVLDGAGYITPEVGQVVQQPESVLLVLRLFVSFVPVLLLLISLPLAYFYPITPEKYQAIEADLAARRQQNNP
jgi:GPH family glycoside/pentoside/hexuronide:cation symporter